MANEIQIFSNPQFGEIRTAISENNEPMFCYSTPQSHAGLRLGSTIINKFISA